MKFTRRGMHVRKLPELEFKFVRVIRGVVLDVILDCRPESKSFGSWAMFKLEALNGDGIIVPGGFAHGIQTLTDDTTLIYAMEIPYDSNLDITINSEDFDLGIKWGENFNSISDKDRNGISWQNYINFFKPTS
jgi:dTDP-4-dehydrorhamnose 3,5-epimerase